MENKAENNIDAGIEKIEKDIREKTHTLEELKHKKSMLEGENEYCAKISNVIYEYRYCLADSLEEAEAKFSLPSDTVSKDFIMVELSDDICIPLT